MAARFTLERILRDDDDAVASSVREWKIEAEGGRLTISTSGNRAAGAWIMVRPGDLETFITDLRTAAQVSREIP